MQFHPLHMILKKQQLNEDIKHSSVPEDRTSPTPPSQVLALTSQCDTWLHVAYGV